MLLSMRDATECSSAVEGGCTYPGQLAYRRGAYKLIWGHPALRGKAGDGCEWTTDAKSGKAELDCWNGWEVPRDVGASRPPTPLPKPAGLPSGASVYQWGTVMLFNIEEDPLEEHDLSASQPAINSASTACSGLSVKPWLSA